MFYYHQQLSIKELDKTFSLISQKLKRVKLPKNFHQFILYALAELLANIQEHSRAKKVILELKLKERTKFFLYVKDNGIGLRKSYLRKGIYPKDSFSAIEFALSGLSTKDTQERGFGLYTLKKFIQDLKGTMELTSGKGRAKIEGNNIKFQPLKNPKKGVEVKLTSAIKAVDFYKNIE